MVGYTSQWIHAAERRLRARSSPESQYETAFILDESDPGIETAPGVVELYILQQEFIRNLSVWQMLLYTVWLSFIYFATRFFPLRVRAWSATPPMRTFCARHLADGNYVLCDYLPVLINDIKERRDAGGDASSGTRQNIACYVHTLMKLSTGRREVEILEKLEIDLVRKARLSIALHAAVCTFVVSSMFVIYKFFM